MKTEYVKVDNLNDAFRVIFSGENVKAIDLRTALKELDESPVWDGNPEIP